MGKIVELVGKRIRECRKSKNLSQEELAFKSGLHTAHLGRIERGEENATFESVEKILSALEVPFQEFFNFESDSVSAGKLSNKEPASTQTLEEAPFLDKTVSYLRKMSEDERKDVYKTIKMLLKWKGKS
ncbi:MAG: helix-turn-helix domain-containing protein [Clostridia bacterium]